MISGSGDQGHAAGPGGSVGVTAADNRLFVEAVIYRYRAGVPWRDLPTRFGDWNNTHRRFSRWAKSGAWKRIFQHLAADADNEYAMIDSTNRLDRFHLLILDDLAYVSKDQAETSVLFELLSARYEHRSMLITANQPFGAWGKVFPDPAMTLAAVDRLVHHATIFEINVESYRRRAALERKQKGAGRPQKHATIKDLDPLSLRDNQTQI